jgi:hypothetical protein
LNGNANAVGSHPFGMGPNHAKRFAAVDAARGDGVAR